MIKIEKKAYSIPAAGGGSGRGISRYPFKTMAVGESFFVPLNGRHPQGVQSSIMGCVRHARFPTMKFTTRFIKSEDGIRVWRTN